MADKAITRRLTIYVNGKEVERTITNLRKEYTKARAQMNRAPIGTKEWERAAKQVERLGKELDYAKKEHDQFIGSVRKGNGELEKQTSMFQKGLGLFGIASAGVLAANAITGVVGKVQDFIAEAKELQAEAKSVDYAFAQIDNSAEILERTRKATRRLMSDLDIKKAANTFDTFKLNLEPFPELLQFVSTRAAQTGASFDMMLSSMVEGLSKESKLRIDNLGISQKELNAELEKTPDFVQAVANIATRELGKAGNILDEAANSQQKWNVAVENLQVALGSGSFSKYTRSLYEMGAATLNALMPAKDLNTQFEDQARKVVGLEKDLVPLINEYDNLKSKSSLSAKEQDRLKVVIGEISEIVPSAITEFDEYGNALDISSDKARGFLETQKAMLAFRNQDALKEQTKQLKEYEKQVTLLNLALNSRDDEGDLVKKTTQTGRGGFSMTTTMKLSDDEISDLQRQLNKYQQLVLGAEESIDQLSGDYLDKYKEREAEKTRIALEELQKRAKELGIDIENRTAAELKGLIAKEEALEPTREAARKKADEDAKKKLEDLKKQAEKEKEYRDKLIIEGKDLLDQERAAHDERLKNAGLFGKEKENLTADDLLALETLNAQHAAKISKIETDAINKHLADLQTSFEKAKRLRDTDFNNELAAITTLTEAKKLLAETLGTEELAKINTFEKAKAALKREHEKEELVKQAEYLQSLTQILTNAMNSGEIEGVNLADKILTEDQKESLNAMLDEVGLKLSEIGLKKSAISGGGEEGDGLGADMESDVDILGFSSDDWEVFYQNLRDGVAGINEIEMAVGGLMNLWGAFNKYVEASEKAKLKKYEQANEIRKKSLQSQLDQGLISREQFDSDVNRMDKELEHTKAKMEEKAARRQKSMAIIGTISNTAMGIMKAYADLGPIGGTIAAALIGTIGALQIATISKQEIPSYAQGGETGYGDLGLGQNSGGYIRGNVEEGEYVVPKFVRNDPEVPKVIDYLEEKRQDKLSGRPSDSRDSGSSLDPEAIYAFSNAVNRLVDNGVVAKNIWNNRELDKFDKNYTKLKDTKETAKITT